MYTITAEKITENIQNRINLTEAEVKALKAVKINTKLKTLTNRAISGEGARIGDYLSNGAKALFVSYTVKFKDHTKYEMLTLNAYSYNDINGEEIGVDGIMRISRTITPTELQEQVNRYLEAKINIIKELKKELNRAESTAKKRAKLVEQVEAFNKTVSFASGADLNIRH